LANWMEKLPLGEAGAAPAASGKSAGGGKREKK
jgi:hypothetical protein